MDRLACVDIPLLPLQLLARRYPEWKGLPKVVIERDDPQGRLLWVDEAAWRSRIRPGMRYGAALALERRLRAAVVPTRDILTAVEEVAEDLLAVCPRIEPLPNEPGTFWLDGSGMDLLFPDRRAWGRAILALPRARQLEAVVVVGHSRFDTYAIARTQAPDDGSARPLSRIVVIQDRTSERLRSDATAIERLGITPASRDLLDKLGIRTVADLRALPPGTVRNRFGPDLVRLYAMAKGQTGLPPAPWRTPVPLRDTVVLDEAVEDSATILFLVRRLLLPQLETAADRGQAVGELRLKMTPRPRPGQTSAMLEECLKPAAPTLEARILLELVHLRLEAHPAGCGIVEVDIELVTVTADNEQLEIFASSRRRDLAAANRALARLRAELGEDAVTRATLRQGHLPEAGFRLEPMNELSAPRPRQVLLRPMVRRILPHPRPLPGRIRDPRDAQWQAGSVWNGRLLELLGPYVISGAWWRQEVHRDYHFAISEKGEILWLYHDRQRRRWFLQGRVE